MILQKRSLFPQTSLILEWLYITQCHSHNIKVFKAHKTSHWSCISDFLTFRLNTFKLAQFQNILYLMVSLTKYIYIYINLMPIDKTKSCWLLKNVDLCKISYLFVFSITKITIQRWNRGPLLHFFHLIHIIDNLALKRLIWYAYIMMSMNLHIDNIRNLFNFPLGSSWKQPFCCVKDPPVELADLVEISVDTEAEQRADQLSLDSNNEADVFSCPACKLDLTFFF